MSTKIDQIESVIDGVAGGTGSEPGGRASRPAGGEPFEIPEAVRDRLSDGVIDELLAGARTEEEIVGPGGVLARLTKRLVERAMSAELSEHLGYELHQEPSEALLDHLTAVGIEHSRLERVLMDVDRRVQHHGPPLVETEARSSLSAQDRAL
jgi:hypothetical protein